MSTVAILVRNVIVKNNIIFFAVDNRSVKLG